MPTSSPEGKAQIAQWCDRLRPSSLVDVGPGAGWYSGLREYCAAYAELTAVEVWAPYIAKYQLDRKYDRVVVADVRMVNWLKLRPQAPAGRAAGIGLVVFGDVLEHLPADQARDVLAEALLHAEHVIVSLPIVHWPQGEHDGNPYEAHLSDWRPQTAATDLAHAATLPHAPRARVVDSWTGSQIGVYLIRGVEANEGDL